MCYPLRRLGHQPPQQQLSHLPPQQQPSHPAVMSCPPMRSLALNAQIVAKSWPTLVLPIVRGSVSRAPSWNTATQTALDALDEPGVSSSLESLATTAHARRCHIHYV